MPRKESNIASKHIPTKKEVKEPTNKMLKAIANSEKEPLKAADEVETTESEVVTSSIFDNEVKLKAPAGKALVFETILPNVRDI